MTLAPFLFALSLFAGAALLFLVEPMLARMLLPLLGGTPAVWNTCLVFFQAALPVLPLGIAQGRTPPAQANPVGWILSTLFGTVGLPFFALSASAPILPAHGAQFLRRFAGNQ
jgi:hypothetical protein